MKTPRAFTTGGRFNIVAEGPRCPKSEPHETLKIVTPTGPNIVANAERDTLETGRPVNPNPPTE
jgi:hypothetical protein